MCGRFTLKEVKQVKETFGVTVAASFNIAPSQEVLTLNEIGEPVFRKWLFSPIWYRGHMKLINARIETLSEKPAFQGVSRCVFVADGWYEWSRLNKGKRPYYHYSEENLIFFAGIYNETSGCAIVTCQSAENISFVHHRQPVLLHEAEIENWMANNHKWNSNFSQDIKFHRVSRAINNPKHDEPENIDEVAD